MKGKIRKRKDIIECRQFELAVIDAQIKALGKGGGDAHYQILRLRMARLEVQDTIKRLVLLSFTGDLIRCVR